MSSPIELIADALEAGDPTIVSDVLVPEQCALVWINGVAYQVTVERVEIH